MSAWIHRHRMTRWLGRLFIALTLFASWGVQAALEYVAPLPAIVWYAYSGYVGPYTSADDACNFELTKLVRSMPQASYSFVGFSPIRYNQSGILSVTSCYWDVTNIGAYPFQARYERAIISSMLCPVPTVNPSLPYSFDWNTAKCYRTAQEALTIALTGATTTEPSQSQTYTATVLNKNDNQPPKESVEVRISLRVDSTSGGHDHGDSARPRGGIDGTKCQSDDICKTFTTGGPGSNGLVTFNFDPSDVSGMHSIIAMCDKCNSAATKNIDVKVEGLWPIFDSMYYALMEDRSAKIIGSTTEHSNNHYIASEAQLQLWQLAEDFYNFQIQKGVIAPTLLHLNDASLKWGGKFDIKGKWRGDHQEHKRGTVIDVRANSSQGAIPPGLVVNFIDIAANLGIDAHLEYIGHPVKQHFHTRLLNRRE